MTAAEVVHVRAGLLRLTETLVAEYRPTLAAGTVIRTVVRSRDDLRSAGVNAGLVPAVEAMARARLTSRLCPA